MKKLIAAVVLVLAFAAGPAAARTVSVITIKGVIDNAVTDFVKSSLEQAKAQKSEALVIQLDTPGGLLASTKDMVQLFLDSDLPVVVYVAPAGASATSAGMMITIAGHVAVMAPGTNIGAAHPVMISPGGDYQSIPKDDIMMEKATKDTVAWVRSICDVRGRNADWAQSAVTDSQSLPAKEAVAKDVVDGIALDLDELVHKFLPGREVKIKGGRTVKLDTAEAQVVTLEMTTAQQLYHAVNSPNVIYVLLLIGFLGIAIEFKSPGLIFPGAIGGACLLFALLAPQLSINYVGLLLIVLAFILLIAELFVTSHGILTVAAVAALVVGSLILFQAPEAPDVSPFMIPALAPSYPVIGSVVLVVTATLLVFGGAILKAQRQKMTTGQEELVGLTAEALAEINDRDGKIFVHGEYWNARSSVPIAKGEMVVIKSVHGLVCLVERVASGVPGPQA